ncbi:MAG: hypothetical protein AB1486_02320 [Planctomycetota bacterium]
MSVGIIVPCETAARRLPQGVMTPLAERPIVQHVVDRLRTGAALDLDLVVVARSSPEDDDLVRWACEANVEVYRTPATDGLSPLLEVAWFYEMDVLVRVVGHSAFVHQPAVDPILDRLLSEGLDYVTTLGLPEGTSPEVISRRALQDLARHLGEPSGGAPLVGPQLATCITRAPERYRFAFELAPPGLRRPEYCLTVEYEDDLARARILCDRLNGNELPSLEEVIAILDREPLLGAWSGQVAVLPPVPA